MFGRNFILGLTHTIDWAKYGTVIGSYDSENVTIASGGGFNNTSATTRHAVTTDHTKMAVVTGGLPSGRNSISITGCGFVISAANIVEDHCEFFYAIKDMTSNSIKADYIMDGPAGNRIHLGHNGSGLPSGAGSPFIGKGNYLTPDPPVDHINSTWKIYHIRLAGVSSFLKINGVTVITGDAGTAAKPADLHLFQRYSNEFRMEGEVGAVILYRGLSSDSDGVLNALKSYTGINF